MTPPEKDLLYSGDRALPPLDGSLTIPETIDFHWRHNPHKPIYVYSTAPEAPVTEISFLEFGRACHRVAYLLRPQSSFEEKDNGKIVAFIALTDSLLYQAITVGIMKAGLVPFPISPRITPAAVAHLLKKTSCHHLLTTPHTLKVLIDGLKEELASPEYAPYNLEIEEIPTLAQAFPKIGKEVVEDEFQPYPEAPKRVPLTDVAIYLHSSGSTGFPKAIGQTHLILVHWAAFPCLLEFRDHQPRVTIAGMPLPPFHTLGVYTQVMYALYGVTTIALYPPVVNSKDAVPMMPTPDNILDHTRRTNSNAMITIPALLQIWAQSVEAVNFLKELEFVGYSGGAVTQKLGDFMVASGVKLNPGYGGTEFGSPTYALPRKGDENEWAYVEFSDRAKVRWAPQGDGTYECQFLVTPTHSLPIENLPDVRGYATSDLWERHPTKDYLWKIVGRIDDVIIHSSGEKTVPAPMEDIVMSSPLVLGTVMFGREHDQAGILIEVKTEHEIDVEDQEQLIAMRNKLWPIVEEANQIAPAFSRIFKELIIVTAKGKPLPRTGKGTVMKKMALKLYHEDIEALYATIESTARVESVPPPKNWNRDTVEVWLAQQAQELKTGHHFSPEDDLFEHGFDSLSATILRRRIVGAIQASPTHDDSSAQDAARYVTQNMVYNYPTIQQLTEYIISLVNPDADGVSTPTGTQMQNIEAMIEKYSVGLDGSLPLAVTQNDVAEESSTLSNVVLLTGSTGNLGSQILEALLQRPDVRRVYALNRPGKATSPSALERQQAKFLDKGLDVSLLESEKHRVTFVEGDSGSARFGLSEALYTELQDTVTVVIHNAWRLDFNLSLSSFESNIRGTRNLIDFARAGRNVSRLRFIFTSSISSAQGWDTFAGAFPEEVITDASVAVGGGYGESKYVAERILAESGLNFSSLRIGQISGGKPNGSWATSDWVPILVKSSLALGAFPTSIGVASWIPMDAAANALLDVAFTNTSEVSPALNFVHPHPVPWDDVIRFIADAVAEERGLDQETLRVIPFDEWYALLEKKVKNSSDSELDNIPAAKLLDFFAAFATAEIQLSSSRQETGGISAFSTKKSQQLSGTLQGLKPIGKEDARRWVKYWKGVGHLD